MIKKIIQSPIPKDTILIDTVNNSKFIVFEFILGGKGTLIPISYQGKIYKAYPLDNSLAHGNSWTISEVNPAGTVKEWMDHLTNATFYQIDTIEEVLQFAIKGIKP